MFLAFKTKPEYKNCQQISFLLLIEFEQISKLLFPLKSSEKL